MTKYFIIVFISISAALLSMYFFVGVPRVYEEEKLTAAVPHIYKNKDRKISSIRIAAVYFVPKNKESAKISNWKELLESRLRKLLAFHSLQFRGTSKIDYEIYPEPIIGLKENLSYDTEHTDRGNPKALINIANELDGRLFKSSGDLFRKEFFYGDKDSYPVLFIMYEGVGASGGMIYESELESISDIARNLGLPEEIIFKVEIEAVDGFFLVSRTFFTDQQHSESLAVHEFYHTLGVPDEYDVYQGSGQEVAITQDIMGSGRKIPLEKTYVKKSILKEMGL